MITPRTNTHVGKKAHLEKMSHEKGHRRPNFLGARCLAIDWVSQRTQTFAEGKEGKLSYLDDVVNFKAILPRKKSADEWQ